MHAEAQALAQVLVRDARSMMGAIKRMHLINDGIVFWNAQRSFKLMVRNDPQDPETIACELAIVVDEEDEPMVELLDMCNDGYVDEPGTLVLESWSFPAAEFGEAEASKIMHVVNEAYEYRVCPCNKYLIKDESTMCLFCHMTATALSKQSHFCAICCEEGLEMHMKSLPCCQQHLHARCIETWHAKSGNTWCPLCRQ